MKTIKILLLLTLVMCGCRTSSTQLENKSIKEEKIMQRDTINIHDSVYHYVETQTRQSNDTIYVDRYIYYYKQREKDKTHTLDTTIHIKDTVTVYQLTGGEQKSNVSSSASVVIVLLVIVLILFTIVKKKVK